MSTTRHLINRQRRLAAVSTAARERTRTPGRAPRTATAAAPATTAARPRPRTRTAVADRPAAEEPVRGPRARRPARRTVAVTLLALLTVALGVFAAVAASRAGALRDTVAGHNTALTDTARTSEVKGQVAEAVNAVFSYDYADTARTDAAAKKLLTGKAVQQYATMLAQVRAQAPARKLVLTTTVTDTGVVTIDGDRARVLVFADQRNTSTAAGADTGSTYAAAMFAVDAVRQKGTWKIASIDTFG